MALDDKERTLLQVIVQTIADGQLRTLQRRLPLIVEAFGLEQPKPRRRRGGRRGADDKTSTMTDEEVVTMLRALRADYDQIITARQARGRRTDVRWQRAALRSLLRAVDRHAQETAVVKSTAPPKDDTSIRQRTRVQWYATRSAIQQQAGLALTQCRHENGHINYILQQPCNPGLRAALVAMWTVSPLFYQVRIVAWAYTYRYVGMADAVLGVYVLPEARRCCAELLRRLATSPWRYRQLTHAPGVAALWTAPAKSKLTITPDPDIEMLEETHTDATPTDDPRRDVTQRSADAVW